MKKILLSLGLVLAGSVMADGLPQANVTITPTTGARGSEFVIDGRDSRNTLGQRGGVDLRCKTSPSQEWTSFSSSKIRFRPRDIGNFTAQCQVRDRKTWKIQHTLVSYRVIERFPRTARITTWINTVEVGEPIDFQIIVSSLPSENHDDVLVRWDFDSDGVWDYPYSLQKITTYVYDRPRRVSPRAEVLFPDGDSIIVKGLQPQGGGPLGKRTEFKNWEKITVTRATIVAPILSVTPGREGFTESKLFTFDASKSRVPKGGWLEWSVDGKLILEFQNKKKVMWKFDSPGKHEVRVRTCVRRFDPKCKETETTVDIKLAPTDFQVEVFVHNLNPLSLVSSSAFNKIFPVIAGDRVRFSARVRQNASTQRVFVYRWDFESDGQWDTDYLFDAFAEHVYDHSGDYTTTVEVVTVELKNEGIIAAYGTRQVHVFENTAADGTFVHTPEQIFVGERIRFFPKIISQSQLKALGNYWLNRHRVRFDLDGDGIWDTDFRSPTSQEWIFATPGTITARMQIRTPGRQVTTVVQKLEVLEKPALQARVVVSRKYGTPRTRFVFDASASTGRNLRFYWGVKTSLGEFSLGEAAKARRVFTTPGQKIISLRVVDSAGNTDQISFPIEVMDIN